jgi:hypothetical protein
MKNCINIKLTHEDRTVSYMTLTKQSNFLINEQWENFINNVIQLACDVSIVPIIKSEITESDDGL